MSHCNILVIMIQTKAAAEISASAAETDGHYTAEKATPDGGYTKVPPWRHNYLFSVINCPAAGADGGHVRRHHPVRSGFNKSSSSPRPTSKFR